MAALRPHVTSGRLRSNGRKTVFHLTVETEDVNVLDQIREALPEGCRLNVRFVSVGNLKTSPTTSCTGDSGFSSPPDLTTRQRDIVMLLIKGLSNKEIGRKLALSHFTVRNHVSQILRLLKVSSRKGAIARLAAFGFDCGQGPASGVVAKQMPSMVLGTKHPAVEGKAIR